MILNAYLNGWAAGRPLQTAIATTIGQLADAAAALATTASRGPLAREMQDLIAHHADGDAQRRLDIVAEELVAERLRHAPVRFMASEEKESALSMLPGAPIAVAIDPLDGSTNVDVNAPLGMIFSLLPAKETSAATFRQTGRSQLAAGLVVFGPHTSLLLTLGEGVVLFTLDPTTQRFSLARTNIAIPETSREFSVNASNSRFWSPGIRSYVDEMLAGEDGPRGVDFNMRWLGALCGDAYRVLVRGGLYLYPGGTRRGQSRGRLRLLYEASPVAFLVEQAGGVATDGDCAILDIVPGSLHVHTPLIFGSRLEVERVLQHVATAPIADYLVGSDSCTQLRM